MPPCEHCQQSLFDYVYGLLDERETQDVHAHLNACPRCRAELETVQTQQKLMARAARAVVEVPEFALPRDESRSVPQAVPASTETPGVLAMTAAALPRRAVWQRPWVVWSAAAAILLAVGTSVSLYHRTVDDCRNDIAAKRLEYRKVDQEFVSLPAKFAALQKTAIDASVIKGGPYLHVVGPTQILPGARANLHVTLRQADGEPATGKVTVQLIDQTTNQVVQESRREGRGEVRAELDATGAKPGSSLSVVVEAETRGGRARVQDKIQVLTPTYVTRIDTNKVAYQIKDVLFFRVLVLDRYRLTPPAEPMMMRVTLLNPKDEIAVQLKLPTSAGGILAAELPIAEHFLAGNYTLRIESADGATLPVQSASQRLEVVRDLPVPNIEFDQQRYLPGGIVTGGLNLPGGQPTPNRAYGKIGESAVPITIQPQASALMQQQPGAGGGLGQGMGGGASPKEAKNKLAMPGMLQRFPFTTRIPEKVPADAKQLPFTLQLGKGKEYSALVPLEPTDYAVDFFPEGGDLIAGVRNRVFFRVRSRTGEPVIGEGRVILLSSKNEIVDEPYQFGLGYLDFTPSGKETYTVRITSPVKTSEVAQPFAKLGIRSSGVVLHVAQAVGKQQEPIRVTLRNQSPARKMLLVAECRGQLVDQRWIDVKVGSQEFNLDPAPDARGMIRVTAYELQDGALQPVAERLVYRAAQERLQLGFALNTLQHQPGASRKAQITARDEKGQPTAAWIGASVVDERFQEKPRSLSAHFLLLNEIRTGSDLDDAQLILHDAPESTAMLERFLGTHGWRRFVRKQEPMDLTKTEPEKVVAVPIVFSRENGSLESLRKVYEDELDRALPPLAKAAFGEHAQLEARRHDLAKAVHAAVSELHEFERGVQVWIRLTMGAAVALLLAAGLILMGIGAYRIVRQHKVATPAFGGAFACLAVCLGAAFLGGHLGSIDDQLPSLGIEPGRAAWFVLDDIDLRFAQQLGKKQQASTAPIGALAMVSPPGDMQARPRPEQEKKDQPLAKAEAQNLRDQVIRSFTDRDRTEGLANARQQMRGAAMDSRFEEARRAITDGKVDKAGKAKADKAPAPVPPTVPPAPGFFGKGGPALEMLNQKDAQAKNSADKKSDREYAHEHVPNLVSDTLLWSPTLWLPQGAAEVRFDLASGQATYRVLLLGHTTSGRLGFFETRLDVPAVGR